METLDSPDGYADYEEHSFPKWVRRTATVLLLVVAVGVIFLGSITLIPGDPNLYFICLIIGAGFSLFIHESLHYVTASVIGYDPVYVWPKMVYVPEENLPIKHILPMLLAPQLLSLAYLTILLGGVNLTLELIIGWGLFLNIQGSWSDILWGVRRLTWPAGTRVVVSEEQSTYVAFPE